MRASSLLGLAAWALPLAAAANTTDCTGRCRCLPGDAHWPTTEGWNDFNSTIDGRLVATVPLAECCHGARYDEDQCNALQDVWTLPETQYVSHESGT